MSARGEMGIAFKSFVITIGLASAAGGWADPGPGVWREPVSGIEFVRVAGGCFDMGANGGLTGEPGQLPPPPPLEDESPQHRVCLDAYWIGRHEVTEGQWARVMADGSSLRGEGTTAVAGVSREDALRFIETMNEKAKASRKRFRLPTEAEWEHACLAGDKSQAILDLSGENEDLLATMAWYRYPPGRDAVVSPVGRKRPNAFGLYDMLGNVWEWVQDAYRPDGYRGHAATAPVVLGDTRFVIRGGSFRSNFDKVRCGARSYGVPGDRLPTVGLRLAIDGSSEDDTK